MGLTLLSHASLPMSFWDHAFHTAVYIINRLSSSVAPYFVPYSTLFHKEINYNFSKISGCGCFPHTQPYKTNKLQFHSTAFTFLGYSSWHKGYKCLNSNGKIFMSKDVVFDEKTFLYATQVHSWIISLGIIPFFVDFPSQHATQESPFVNIPSESNPPNESNSLFPTT
ncbi:hypothetical protein V8G54_019198 [Vigna mungo]|uniref:Retroviral polymerase SH3-like domain-containing protein n=1 Tax=Vigna mungo TaxID=3915 RepID=A0AAQ3RTH7_VIGMU